jgi:hypothetical protein
MKTESIIAKLNHLVRQLSFQNNARPRLESSCEIYGMWAPPETKGNCKRYDFKIVVAIENKCEKTAYGVRIQQLLLKDKRVFMLTEEDTGQPATISAGNTHGFQYSFSVWLPISQNKFSSTTRLDELKKSIEFVLVFEDAEGIKYKKIQGLHFRKGSLLAAVSNVRENASSKTHFPSLPDKKLSSTRYKYLRG